MENQVKTDRQHKHVEIDNSIENLHKVTMYLDSLITKIDGSNTLKEKEEKDSERSVSLQNFLDGASGRIEACIECLVKKISEIENMIF